VGSRKELLTGKPEPLVKLYSELEKKLKAFGRVEIVARGRYALFRTTRIFADLVFMRDALRLHLLLDRQVTDPLFFKTLAMSAHRISHVAKLRNKTDLSRILPYLKEAYFFARADRRASGRKTS
jgi:predicted transport protein